VPSFTDDQLRHTPIFHRHPGTVSMPSRPGRGGADVLDSLKRLASPILLVNGHGGTPRPGRRRSNGWPTIPHQRSFFNWYKRAEDRAKVQEIDPIDSHASWW